MNANILTTLVRTIDGALCQLPRNRKLSYSSLGKLTILAAMCALLGGQQPAAAWDVYSDNFNDGNDTLPAPAWVHYDPIYSTLAGLGALSLWSYPSNTYTFTSDGSGGFKYHLQAAANLYALGGAPLPPPYDTAPFGPARTIAYRPDIFTNFNITADLMPGWAGGGGVNGTWVQVMGLSARMKTITFGQTAAYMFTYANGALNSIDPNGNFLAIARLQNDASTRGIPGSGNGASGTCEFHFPSGQGLDNSKAYRFQFIGKGTHLEGRVYEMPNTNTPIVVLDANTVGDSIILTNGPCGIFGFNGYAAAGTPFVGPLDMTWDNYTASIHSPYEIRDDFNRGNDGAQNYPPWSAPAWVREDPLASSPLYPVPYTGATFAFPGGNTYQFSSPEVSPAYGAGNPRVFPLRTEVTYGDFYVSGDMIAWDTTHHQEFGLAARVQTPGLGTTASYVFGWENGDLSATDGDLDVLKLIAEGGGGVTQMEHSSSVPAQDSGIHLNAGTQYRFTLSCKGADLRAKVYQLPDTSTPIKELLAHDDTWPSEVSEGYSGLFVFNHPTDTAGNACTVTVDNFYADIAEPRIAMTNDSSGNLVLTWPANLASIWTLQTSPSIAPNAVWTEISGAPAQAISYDRSTGLNTYTASMSASESMFFRLQRLDPVAYP
ncbi:MAG: hypothetical protein NT154_12470 [Verrucomicrobia bacterium]|nr:hypothetical protein [Verrucomicrobiota bacterium]